MRRPVGVKWVLLFFRWTSFFSRRVATVATLPSALFVSDFVSLGASWVFSFQPVLPPDYRPFVHLSMEVGQAIDAVTGTRLWVFDFMRRSATLSGCCCATVRKLLHLPTSDAAKPLTSSPLQ